MDTLLLAQAGYILFAVAALAALVQTRALARARAELDSERRRADLVVRATQSGIIDWDVNAGVVSYSRRFKEILDFPAQADLSDRTQYFDTVHPEDRSRAREGFVGLLRELRETGVESLHPPIEYRLKRAGGAWGWGGG